MNDNHSSDSDSGKSNKGFAGFDSMVTDNLDKTIADVFQGNSDKKPQELPRNIPNHKQVSSQSATPPVDNPNSKRETTPHLSTQSSHDTKEEASTTEVSQPPNVVNSGTVGGPTPSQLKNWIWGICAILFVMYMSSLFIKNSSESRNNFENTTYSVPPTSLTTDSPSASPPNNTSIRNSLSSEISQNKTIDQPTEEKPPVGTDRVLTRNQIRYCLSEKIRLDAAEEKINNYLAGEVDQFNGMIDDYNNRCGKFRYRSGLLEAVRTEVEVFRQTLAEEGRLRFISTNEPSSSTENRVTVPSPREPDQTVVAIQKLLNSLEYNAGPADGLIGLNTTAAIKAFQRDQNLFVDGVASTLLLNQIKNAVVSQIKKNIEVQRNSPPLTQRQPLSSERSVIQKEPENAIPDQTNSSQQVRSKEDLENLKTCLNGNYPSLCKRELLTSAESAQVDAAERRENLKTCLNGNYPSLCKRELLTSAESAQVDAAERRVSQ